MRVTPLRIVAGLATLASPLAAQHDTANSPGAPMYVAPASGEGQAQIARFKLDTGLVCDLVAAEPHLCNAVAFAIDDRGRFYVAETFRINDGVFDTRNFMQWKDADLACRSVQDRVAKYHKYLGKDIPRLSEYSERVRLLFPGAGGVVERDTVFATGFNELADGIGAGVLAVGNDVFFTNIPKLWRLRDKDGDGVADERTALHDGFGVHTSLIGHDLHGLVVGPDRRLYFSIGDRGFRVETEGRVLDYPHEGAVLRCELDGSHLEVWHRGLRNPQELAFDDLGDLFTGDNNSDAGDQARFVQIIEGGDSGWCIGHQWLDDRGRWMREKLWWPQFPGQAAWIVPPIINVADGPSGLAYDPGLGLPERYRGCFFLCDFRGGSGYSGVHALRFQAQGAGHELVRHERPIWGVLCTDVEFGPDGALYVLDWVDGWNKTGKGRIYRVRTEAMANDLPLRAVAQLLAADFASRAGSQLLPLLGHVDRRVRQKAEFALVDQRDAATLLAAAKNADAGRARLHGIWGLGVLGRSDAKVLDDVRPLLADGEAEVRAQAAKVLGDVRVAKAGPALVKLLDDRSARVRCQAALALSRLGAAAPASATKALLHLLAQNDDRDPFLRHAAVLALASLDASDAIEAALTDTSRAVRLGAVVALRRLGDPAVARALRDVDVLVAAEAARAIYDAPIADALPQLAQLVRDAMPDCEPLQLRAVNAARLVGTPEAGADLLAFAQDKVRPLAMRVEALTILGEWRQPHGQDRVFGTWRPAVHADGERVADAVGRAVPELLAGDEAIVAVAAAIAGRQKIHGAAAALLALVVDGKRAAATRSAALTALDQLDAKELDAAVQQLDASAPAVLRRDAVAIAARRNPERAVPVLATLLQASSLAEQQGACRALGELKVPAATALLGEWLQRLADGKVAVGFQLDLLEACAANGDAALQQRLAARTAVLDPKNPVAAYGECRAGGDGGRGREIFFSNEASRCTRCHTCQGTGGNAGPVLDGVGRRRDADYLLRALVTPSAEICEGFATTVLELHNGDHVVGIVTHEGQGVVEVMDIDGKLTSVPQDRIKSRSTSKDSAMPVMTGTLDRRQLRDVLAFLQSLRDEPKK